MEKKFLKRVLLTALVLLLALALASCDITGLVHLVGPDIGEDGDPSFVPSETTDVTKSDFENSYRDQLAPNELAFYDAVAAAHPGAHVFHVNLTEALELCKGRAPTKEEQDAASAKLSYWITNALFAVWLDVPSLFWLETGNYSYQYNIEPHTDDVYRVGDVEVTVDLRAGCEENPDFMKTRVGLVLNERDLIGANDYETLKNINRYLCELITYKDTEHRATVYGALVEKECVCEGYAHALQLFCQKYEIPCVCIVGTGVTEAGSEGHMWNAVKLGDSWYAVDTTWNDTTESEEYFLVGSHTESHGMRFSASHLSDNKRGNGKEFALPALSANAYTQN